MTEQELLAAPFADRDSPGIVVTRTRASVATGDGHPFRTAVVMPASLTLAIDGARAGNRLFTSAGFLFVGGAGLLGMAASGSPLVFFFGLFFVVGYWLLADAVNATTIHLAGDHLDVRRGPLPWPGRRRRFIGVMALEHRRVKRRFHVRGDGPAERYHFQLVVVDRHGNRGVAASVNRATQATFVVDTVNAALPAASA